MKKKRRLRYKKNINFIEIKTNKRGWISVELIACLGKRIIIRLPEGQVISRKNIHVRPMMNRTRIEKSRNQKKDKFVKRYNKD